MVRWQPMSKWRIPQPIRNAVASAWAHHHAELLKLNRLVFAKSNCIEDSHVHDFPPSNTSIKNNSALATAVTAASVLGGVGLGAAGMQMLTADKPSPPAVIETVTPVPAADPVSPDPARAQIELYYNDPEQGLVPITGAASTRGAELKTN